MSTSAERPQPQSSDPAPSRTGLRTGLSEGAAGFALALQFLTSAPELLHRPATPRELGRSMSFFPLVGALVGLALAGLDAILGLAFGEPVRSALVVAAMLLLTRGLHLDGLMDTFDGLFGGWSPERRLEIMRDSRVGTFGVLAGATDLLLRVAVLSALPAGLRLPALILAPTLGRWSLVYATSTFPYARPTGMGAAFKQQAGPARLLGGSAVAVACAAGAALGVGGMPLGVIAVPLAAWLAAAALGRYVLTKLPGQTGDTYGATNEVVEVVVLLLFSLRFWGTP